MIQKRVVIQNKCGLHLRPAGVFCNTASRYKSKIMFEYGIDKRVNAKSVLNVLGAGIKHGEMINLICDGFDEEEAMEALLEAIETGLGEAI